MAKRKTKTRFVICVKNEDCEDLQLRKLYRALPDKTAEKDGFLRIVDESGEDYLYPTEFFIAIEFPKPVAEKLLSLATLPAGLPFPH
jgi:hypothetical protein